VPSRERVSIGKNHLTRAAYFRLHGRDRAIWICQTKVNDLTAKRTISGQCNDGVGTGANNRHLIDVNRGLCERRRQLTVVHTEHVGAVLAKARFGV
jgi:hypothetical protein